MTGKTQEKQEVSNASLKKMLDEQAKQIKDLQDRNEALESQQPKMPNTSLLDEIKNIRKKAGPPSNRVIIKDVTDHKNIFLFTPLNKRIGPLHPKNAESTLIRWHERGFPLFTAARTPEQIQEFKKTDLYKKEHSKHTKERQKRRNLSKKLDYDDIAKLIAKEFGVIAKDLTSENIRKIVDEAKEKDKAETQLQTTG